MSERNLPQEAIVLVNSAKIYNLLDRVRVGLADSIQEYRQLPKDVKPGPDTAVVRNLLTNPTFLQFIQFLEANTSSAMSEGAIFSAEPASAHFNDQLRSHIAFTLLQELATE